MTEQQKQWVIQFLGSDEGAKYVRDLFTPLIDKKIHEYLTKQVKKTADDPADWWKKPKDFPKQYP
jgi:hypothetical protein